MGQVERFSVSLDIELLAAFDRLLESRGFANRSEAVRDMIREALLEARGLGTGGRAVVSVAFIVEAEPSDAQSALARRLDDFRALLRGWQVVPVGEKRSTHAITMIGPPADLRAAIDDITAQRGVSHVRSSVLSLDDAAGVDHATASRRSLQAELVADARPALEDIG